MNNINSLRPCSPLKYSESNHITDQDLRKFLQDNAQQEPAWILGHDLDGVIWGCLHNNNIRLAYDIQSNNNYGVWKYNNETRWGAPLRKETLLELRMFSQKNELRLWKKDGQLMSCSVTEGEEQKNWYCYDQPQILIAGKVLDREKLDGEVNFSLLEGPAGQKQALPVPEKWDGTKQQYRLWVRHYAEPDDKGMLRVIETRLLGIFSKDNHS